MKILRDNDAIVGEMIDDSVTVDGTNVIIDHCFINGDLFIEHIGDRFQMVGNTINGKLHDPKRLITREDDISQIDVSRFRKFNKQDN